MLVGDLLHRLIAQLHPLPKELMQSCLADPQLNVSFDHFAELCQAQRISVVLEEIIKVRPCPLMDLSELASRFVFGKELIDIKVGGFSYPLDTGVANAKELGQNPNRHIPTSDPLDTFKLKLLLIFRLLTLKLDLLWLKGEVYGFSFFV